MQGHHILVIASAIGLLFLMAQQNSRSFEWRFMAQMRHSHPLSAPSSRSPFAVVDFDHDGVDELLMVATSGTWQVLRIYRWSAATNNLEELLLQKRLLQMSALNIAEGNSGNIPDEEPVDGSDPTASQDVLRVIKLGAVMTPSGDVRIVVVTNAMDVIVLDSSLNQKWRAKLPMPKLYRVRKGKKGKKRRERLTLDISIAPSTPPLWAGDEAAVVVGVHIQLSEQTWRTWKHAEEFQKPKEPQLPEDEQGYPVYQKEDPNENDMLKNHRVSYYALDSRTGELRWQRLGAGEEEATAAVVEAQQQGNASYPREHIWKIDAALDSGHFEQTVWHNFRDSMVKVLPHGWFGLDDTKLSIAHFNKKQHSRSTTPNVIIAQSVNGIEALHMYSGRAVTSLALRPYALYADIDHDGTIEQVWASGCQLLFGAGVPHLRTLVFNATLCENLQQGEQIANSNLVLLPATSEEDSWLGIDQKKSEAYRIAHLLSNGVMSGVPVGIAAQNANIQTWHVATPATWQADNTTQRGILVSVSVDSDSSLSVLGVASDLVLVSSNGQLLASTSLTDHVDSVITGRFSSHQPTLEVILVTPTHLQFFSLEAVGAPAGIVTLVFIGIALAIFNQFKSVVISPGTFTKKE